MGIFLPILLLVAWTFGGAASEVRPSATGNDVVRVRILASKKPRNIIVQAVGGGMHVVDETGKVLLTNTREGVHLSRQGSRVLLDGTPLSDGGAVQMKPAPGAVLEVRVSGGASAARALRYAGSIRVSADSDGAGRLLLVNHVGLEDYVAAVLPREYGFDDVEGARAMAILIRTVALQAENRQGAYDVVDDTGSQVYDGAGGVTERSREAALSTRGQVLTYRGSLTKVYYHSSSGGHTADNESVWKSAPLPYLRGRPDPYDRTSPFQQWTSRIPRARLHAVLERTYGSAVKAVAPGARGADGRVTTVTVQLASGARTVPSNNFRLAVMRALGAGSLRSTAFTLQTEGDTYVFRGSGNGHGVGLSQYGAREMARRGMSHREILAHYFAGTIVTDLDAVAPHRRS